MICEYCGTSLEEGAALCPLCGAVQTRTPSPVTISEPDPNQTFAPIPESKPEPEAEPVPAPQPEPPAKRAGIHPALRVLLSLCTVVLCVLLCVSLVATSLVMDLQRLTSENGLSAMVGDLLWERPSDIAAGRFSASFGGIGNMDIDLGDLGGLKDAQPENLVDFVYDALKDQYGDEIKITPDQVQTFVEESTAKDFVSDKLVSYGTDLLTGQNNTTISNDEILGLIDENLDLVESTFGVTVDRSFRTQVEEFLNENDINGMIQKNIMEPVSQMEIPGLTPLLSALSGFTGTTATFTDLMVQLQVIASARTLTMLMLVNAILVILLLLTNRLRIGSTFISAGVPALITGTLLALPVALIQLLPVLLGSSLGLATIAVNLIGALAGRIAPVHYGMAITGLVLIIIGAIIKAVTKKAKAE